MSSVKLDELRHDDSPYRGAGDLESGQALRISRVVTPGGHPAEYDQPALPHQHRTFGNPAPLGLCSFGCGFFLASFYTLHTRDVHINNLALPMYLLYGGVSQTLVGWWEMFLGNTYSATVFASYGAFNLTFGAIYLPAFGIIDAYRLSDGSMSPQFDQALGLYFVVWTIITVLFWVGSLRSSVAVLCVLGFTALAFACLGAALLTGSATATIAGGGFGMCASVSAWWAAMSGFWTKDVTLDWVRISPIELHAKKQ